MLAAWVMGTDRNLFPFHRNTAFKLTFEGSRNKLHSVGLCWWPRACIREQTLLQNTRSFSWKKYSLTLFWHLWKKHISVSW